MQQEFISHPQYGQPNFNDSNSNIQRINQPKKEKHVAQSLSPQRLISNNSHSKQRGGYEQQYLQFQQRSQHQRHNNHNNHNHKKHQFRPQKPQNSSNSADYYTSP